MKLNALKGMRDILPEEQKIRDFIQGKILETYTASGFERISTPILEDSVNIAKSEGGENLNLVFNVLKRGEKLDSALKENPSAENLSDMALRYDLTLPLARFFAANKNRLQLPFKVIQTDRVYRAERPQKGRLREFVQCDIDILGDKSPNAEVELIDVTSRAMLKIGFNDFSINVNDRRLLREMLVSMGFSPDSIESVSVTFDKLDKIGVDGVQAELLEKNFNEKSVKNLSDFLSGGKMSLDSVSEFVSDKSIVENLRYVMDNVRESSGGKYDIVFTPSLVRGQGYYTGMVFEISSPHFSGAVGGGGRYDKMIGKFIGEEVPAVGFSIGFERICSILLENNFAVPSMKEKCAVLYDDSVPFSEVLKEAEKLRENYIVSVIKKAKKMGPQFSMLEEHGYTKFAQLNESGWIVK